LLNGIWYAGAFGIGLAAGRLGSANSLGFVLETERQVEEHLEKHMSALPEADRRSRLIVEQMKSDEARHAANAADAGGQVLPAPVRLAMKAAARVMTTTAYYV
jgi:ubiquinone biosynthesis monooxygenase Coq7